MYSHSSMVPHPSILKSHSFRLILYLEWILLGIMLLLQIRPARFGINPASLGFSMLCLIGFGLMGLKLPVQKFSDKLGYTLLEFGLLFLNFWLDHRTGFFPMLGLIIVIRACLMFQQAGRLIVTSLVFIAFLLMQFFGLTASPRPHHRPIPIPESIANTILTLKLNTVVTFGLTLLFMLLLVNALLAERESREKLLKANDQLRQYALRIEDQATLQERNRIAREIHDALGHALTAQSIQLENALLFLPPNAEKSEAFLREAKQLGSTALKEVRRSISTLRSNPLQGQSLDVAITKAVSEFRNNTNIEPECTIKLSQPIPTEISTALYRIVQESLTNIYKHSDATFVRIDLHNTAEAIFLQIEDNGKGFDPNVNSTGFGLQGMRERTTALTGKFFLTSESGKGCCIRVSIPLPRLGL
ncbi:sensor histidine kinase [Ancylothrix sp. C2]|uniref:sensor histidine kinase n=1 Tax=Ancylothrix sp. D3o TaxID=2953691 RepID=UPI0021BB9416|nr:sensor histidine kinase [Ancylothrix sp. D3o]MCT7949445.1 sensor histidine kinase [Ancylothrix sp. D3o]